MQFDTWRKAVDAELRKRVGLGIDYLPDTDWWAAWQAGDLPQEAADDYLAECIDDMF